MHLKGAFIVVSVVIPAATNAQQLRSLGRPTAEFQEPFTRVATLRELSDGRVIVGDEHDATSTPVVGWIHQPRASVLEAHVDSDRSRSTLE